MSETRRGHLWEKIIVKLFASSWYIFLAGALHDLYVSLFKNFQLKQIALGYWVLLETRVGTRSRNSPYCMEHEGLLPYAQELATCKLRHGSAVHPLPSWQWPPVKHSIGYRIPWWEDCLRRWGFSLSLRHQVGRSPLLSRSMLLIRDILSYVPCQ